MLVHSCIYYHLNQNSISDKKWDEWARELKTLQEHYPDIAKQVTLYEYFKDWDASTGAFLPITKPWVIAKAKMLIGRSKDTTIKVQLKPKKSDKGKKRLF